MLIFGPNIEPKYLSAVLDTVIYEKLTRYCAYQERCVADVKTKLYSLKTVPNDFDGYITRLQEENFLNEERYVKAFIEAHTRKKWGKTKMKSALSGKRIDSALVKKYLDRIEEEDYEEQIKALAQKKWQTMHSGPESEKKNKLIRFLLSKGFEMGKILEAIKNT